MSNKGIQDEREPLEAMTALQLNDILTSETELYCINCFDFLCPPIMLGEKGNVCGNCSRSASGIFIQNKALEKILQKLSVQCINFKNGCKVRNDYKEVAVHNKLCIYRKISCPINLYDCCEWLDYSYKLVDHFFQQHPQNIRTAEVNSISVDVNVEDIKYAFVMLMMLPYGNFVSLINSDDVDQTLSIAVFYVDYSDSETHDCNFVAQLNCLGDNKYICQVQNQSSIPNIGCYNDGNNYVLTIDTDQLKKQSTNGFFKCTIKLITNSCEYKINEELLQHFECPVCNNYMIAPIYQCDVGHSICSSCKPKLWVCPTCKRGFQDTRNFTLEAIGNHSYFPCHYLDRGCLTICLGSDIVKHEDECRFKSYHCPFKENNCQWNGLLTDLSIHLKTSHADLTCIKNEDILIVPYNGRCSRSYCLRTYGEIFMVYYSVTYDESVFWIIQLVGPESKCRMYSCEVTLTDERYPCKKFITVDKCEKYGIQGDLLITSALLIPRDLITSFLNNGQLTFNVKVVQNKI